MNISIIILLIILIGLTLWNTYNNTRIKNHDYTTEFKAIAKESLDDLVQKDFEIFDLQEKVFDTVMCLRYNPQDWNMFSDCVLENTKTGVAIWTANEIKNRQFYRGENKGLELSMLEKTIIDSCCNSVVRWNREKENEINEIIENKFVK